MSWRRREGKCPTQKVQSLLTRSMADRFLLTSPDHPDPSGCTSGHCSPPGQKIPFIRTTLQVNSWQRTAGLIKGNWIQKDCTSRYEHQLTAVKFCKPGPKASHVCEVIIVPLTIDWLFSCAALLTNHIFQRSQTRRLCFLDVGWPADLPKCRVDCWSKSCTSKM